ncbi:MAG: hypothetical protein ACOX88_08750 [Christensenellales bacterium]|jgi:hypothetical protein
MLYQILGIINVVLLVVVTAPYWLLRKWFFPETRAAFARSRWIKSLRAAHKPLGICLLLLAAVHGYLALGALRLHTGTLAGIMIFITVVLGIIFYIKKKPALFKWHKRAALITVLLTLLHLLFPGAL